MFCKWTATAIANPKNTRNVFVTSFCTYCPDYICHSFPSHINNASAASCYWLQQCVLLIKMKRNVWNLCHVWVSHLLMSSCWDMVFTRVLGHCLLWPSPLTPKSNQYIQEPKCICDQNLVKFPSLVFSDMVLTKFSGCTNSLTCGQMHPKMQCLRRWRFSVAETWEWNIKNGLHKFYMTAQKS